jgi:type I restriction enzyme R subunit
VSSDYLPAEARARVQIDRQLARAGWLVVDRSDLNLFAGPGIAVRETIMALGHGRADYLLYVDKQVVGVIEAKPEGTPLSGVEWQSAMYADGLPEQHRRRAVLLDGRLPFVFEANAAETHLTNGYDPDPRARRIFNFPRPETLGRWVRDAEAEPASPTWRAKVRSLPPLATANLRPAQVDAIQGIERSLAAGRHSRSLVQMATGAGKTYAAVTESYRLLKYGGFNRVLFLVDRNNLGRQTLREFQAYVTPDDGRKFTELYPVDRLTGAGMLGSSKVVISKIQRLYSVLRGQEVADVDDEAMDSYVADRPVEVDYSPDVPPETFDLVIVDECHRSIYGNWRGVVEYFDAHVTGLTATPVKQTFGFFQQNLVSEYTYEEAVADRVNVDFDVYRIRTEITGQGSAVDAGATVPVRDRRTRRERYQTLDEELLYTAGQVDRAVTARHQIRLVLETFRDRLFMEIFPGGSVVPKTLIFCKDDNHAEEVVTCVREVFGKGNDFAAKITYSARNPDELLQTFRNSPTLRVAVTVDMIATGTDVKAARVCLLHARRAQPVVLRADEGPGCPDNARRRLPRSHYGEPTSLTRGETGSRVGSGARPRTIFIRWLASGPPMRRTLRSVAAEACRSCSARCLPSMRRASATRSGSMRIRRSLPDGEEHPEAACGAEGGHANDSGALSDACEGGTRLSDEASTPGAEAVSLRMLAHAWSA